MNLQNGEEMYTPGTANTASITVHHSAIYPSTISLPGNNPSLSMNENADLLEFSVYPNPAKDVLHIETDQVVNGINIYDLSGKEVEVGTFKNSAVNISALQSGMYFIRIQTATGSGVKMFKKD